MPASPSDLLLRDLDEGVLTLTMNNPKRLNGWTMEMMDAIKAAFAAVIIHHMTLIYHDFYDSLENFVLTHQHQVLHLQRLQHQRM